MTKRQAARRGTDRAGHKLAPGPGHPTGRDFRYPTGHLTRHSTRHNGVQRDGSRS
ncbi:MULTISPECIES: hypothetical protein [unclassified Streptomyces]|uniref:hypothetical protein n=1 Tax=unclassified Streptomyces TaxID=2593676 RepID=UPI002DDB34C6|nr:MULTISPECIES: hypothetical protein [unclassified Streptomyces]WSA90837.1 hypothetical protein OIE63_04245 [Streptomyces sp. NBC_01795]WSB75159.1 hypothetical protein OHB04_04775 [Streptomyces sp. NBC_01775]WSS16558.1 hypothetical protein OG533_35125 [Streptomyces sp. NBC_01186]WSS45375.1 hypothetical protein OG220_35805 [Streptomyces sp. NBC_01187]